MKELQLAYSRYEKIANMIANLQKMKETGQVEETDFQNLMNQYEALQKDAQANVQDIRHCLKEEQAQAKKEQAAIETELKNVKLRAQVGEIAPQDVPKVMGKIQKRFDQAAARVMQLAETLAAKGAEAHGGYLPDVDVQKHIEYKPGRKSISLPKSVSLPSGLGDFAHRDEGVWGLWENLRKKIGGHVTSPGALSAIRYVAAGLFCLVTLVLLGKGAVLFRAARFVSGTSAFLGALGEMADSGAGNPFASGGPDLGAGGLYFWAFMALLRAGGFGVAAFAYFASKAWAQIFVFCLSALSILLVVVGVFMGSIGITTVMALAIYGFAIFTSLEL